MTTAPEFVAFPKIARLNREIIITEKIDGTNACVHVTDDGRVYAGSRTRWVTPESDNYGFARWVESVKDQLLELGPGTHHGEWWGSGIQRGYGLKEKRFSLFNVHKFDVTRPACCEVVPTLYRGPFSQAAVTDCVAVLAKDGSLAAPGYGRPEGVVVFHSASNALFKVTCEKDEQPKATRESSAA